MLHECLVFCQWAQVHWAYFYIMSNCYPFVYIWKNSVKQSLNPITVNSYSFINTWLSFNYLPYLLQLFVYFLLFNIAHSSLSCSPRCFLIDVLGSLHVLSSQMTEEDPEKPHFQYPLHHPHENWSPPLLCWYYLIYPWESPLIPLQTWNLSMDFLLNMVAYRLWEYSLFLFLFNLPLLSDKSTLAHQRWSVPIPVYYASAPTYFVFSRNVSKPIYCFP